VAIGVSGIAKVSPAVAHLANQTLNDIRHAALAYTFVPEGLRTKLRRRSAKCPGWQRASLSSHAFGAMALVPITLTLGQS
jgi:hypothetical protein